MSDAKRKEDWSKPAAMAIPKSGYIGEPQRGRYGPSSAASVESADSTATTRTLRV